MANNEETSSDYTHNVFLSSSPKGNSTTFTDYIYQALLDSQITAIRYSEDITTTTIEKCRIPVVVFCENYAYSTRCLDELVNIIDCYDTQQKEVCVIFYKVEPSDVWLQRNCYERGLIEHEKSLGRDSETVKAWKLALSRIRDLGGEHCRDDKYESSYIKTIVKDISAKLPPPPVPFEIKHPIGLDLRFEQLKSLLDIESDNNSVCMLGICGETGIGKTALVSYLYNKIRHQFEVASFLTNIREKSNNNSINGLKDLQRTLLYETVKGTQTMVDTAFEGHSQIKDKLSHKRVLLILDDIDSIEQLKALAGGCDWFGYGSRIIITTRVANELDKHHVTIRKYKMEELNSCESLELFCWHAFKMSKPADNYADICNHVVNFAKGFPRALKALGSNLKGLSVEEWKMELVKYRNVPNAFTFLVDSL